MTEEHCWSPRLWRQESQELRDKPWWQNYRFMAAGMVALTLVALLLFL